MNEGLQSPDGTGAPGPSFSDQERRRPSGGNLLWAITLHSAAGQRWLRHDPPEIEELKQTLAVIETMCAMLDPPTPARGRMADTDASVRRSHSTDD